MKYIGFGVLYVSTSLFYEILSTEGIIYSESKEIVKLYSEFGIKYLNWFLSFIFFINILLCKNIG